MARDAARAPSALGVKVTAVSHDSPAGRSPWQVVAVTSKSAAFVPTVRGAAMCAVICPLLTRVAMRASPGVLTGWSGKSRLAVVNETDGP